MDLEYPFSESFGLASTRDEMIKSAEKVYTRLLKLSPGSTLLPYSVLAALCENDDGTIDKAKRRSILKLFRPDMSEEVTFLSFIQICDSIYKKLRYFRASVGNASVIDKKLEDIVNAIFYFVLTLIVLLLLNFNPWPLLVSLSTLLVSFAFALGPSAAKAIEVSHRYLVFHQRAFVWQSLTFWLFWNKGDRPGGWSKVGEIYFRAKIAKFADFSDFFNVCPLRPFDIGDRIIISDSPGSGVPDVTMSWMVEGNQRLAHRRVQYYFILTRSHLMSHSLLFAPSFINRHHAIHYDTQIWVHQ
jgi:hypothetical protein